MPPVVIYNCPAGHPAQWTKLEKESSVGVGEVKEFTIVCTGRPSCRWMLRAPTKDEAVAGWNGLPR